MKTPLTVLFAGVPLPHAFDPVFADRSAFDRALSWAEGVPQSVQTVVFVCEKTRAQVQAACGDKKVALVEREQWTAALIAKEIAAACVAYQADFAVFVWADLPFLSAALTAELVETHTKYLAEYTFADGYPAGLAPEVVDAGAAGIIATLGEGVQKSAGEKSASRDALFSIMSGDINAFEIETVIAPKDYRMLRLDFSCAEKINALSCARLFAAAQKKINLQSADFDVIALSDLAESDVSVLQTVPAFYNVQISARYHHDMVYTPYAQWAKAHPLSDMPFADFKTLVAQIASLSEKAVVSLSAFGEPLLHPQFVDCVREVLSYPQLTVFIETDGTLVTEQLLSQLHSALFPVDADYAKRIIWVVLLDAVESSLYAQLHHCVESDFSKAVAAVGLLSKAFPHNAYPQLTRMKANEAQLEQFYRFWKNKENASAGELIIQKYNTFCGALPDEKSADLSPLVRIPCWHLRRDLTIFADGTVPFCVSQGWGAVAGNALTEGISAVWERFSAPLSAHLTKDYSAPCKACDEYYTFTF